jgi:hypothetical protein
VIPVVNKPVLLASFLALAWLTPQIASADAESHRASVERLFTLTRLQQKIDESVQTVAALQLQQTPELLPHRDAVEAFLEAHIGWNALHEDLVQMYLQAFSEQELETINAFYSTPAGQKIITTVPQLVQQRNQLAMQRLQQHISELQAIMAAGQPHQ